MKGVNVLAQAIILVGGFGENVYLKRYLQEAFPDTRVIQPPDT
jgi:hypothetical protein